MPENASARDAHDALVAMGVAHESCALCIPAGTERAEEEEAPVPNDKTYTETEHFALLSDAVQRETAAIAQEKEQLQASVTERDARITALEAELAAAKQESESAAKAFEDFKAELAAQQEAEARKTERVAAIKEAAPHLPEDYFTAERANTWAAMPEEVFASLVDGLAAAKPQTAATKTATKTETAAFRGGQAPTDNGESLTSKFLAARFHGSKVATS